VRESSFPHSHPIEVRPLSTPLHGDGEKGFSPSLRVVGGKRYRKGWGTKITGSGGI